VVLIAPEQSPSWGCSHAGNQVLFALEAGTGVWTVVGPDHMGSNTRCQYLVGSAGRTHSVGPVGGKRCLPGRGPDI